VTYARGKLFLLSVIALVTAGMVFSIRASSLKEMEDIFFKASDPTHSAALIGAVAGAAFLGFAISIFVGSPLCDFMGMGRLLGLSCLCFVGGTAIAITTKPGGSAYGLLWAGMFTMGLGHGLVEAVINPLIATIYPDDKTHRMNVLHAWWPGGIIFGGLIGFGMGAAGLAWQYKMAVVLIPAIAFGIMLLTTKFPATERMAAGVSNADMLKEAFRPAFIVLLLAMLLTASAELAPGQWVDSALTRLVGFQGILLLVYVSGLMFVMRHFAGSLAHKLSPIGLMWVSCLLAALGLVALAKASSPVTGLLAATVWGVGVCYMWPTMLGITSERFPRGGALALGLMGCSGNIAIYYMLPTIGKWFDAAKVASSKALAGCTFDELQKQAADAAASPAIKAQLDKVLAEASSDAFMKVAALPAVLLVVFGIWWIIDKSKGGYQAIKLEAGE
jgi:MFS family permease